MFERIKRWYQQGLWSTGMVRSAVLKGVLTAAEAEEIIND